MSSIQHDIGPSVDPSEPFVTFSDAWERTDDPLPYGRQSINESDIAAVESVLRGNWLTTGPAVDAFEAALTKAVGAPAVTVTSGSAALHATYGGLGLGPGDELVTSPITFASTATSALQLGATVRFADVCDDTANIDPASVAEHLTDRTKIVTGVAYAGHPIDVDALRPIVDRVGAVLVEDAAHSIGGTYQGAPVGSVADVTCFSFFPTKNMTTAEGGAVVSPQADVLAAIRRFARLGVERDPAQWRSPGDGGWWYEVTKGGLNYRLPDVLCALGITQLRRLGDFVARRATLVQRYHTMLADVGGLRLPTQRSDVEPAWHLFPVRVLDGRRRHVYESMRRVGILVQVNYIPVHWHPVFTDVGYRRGMFPVAERFYSEQLSLPLFPGLTFVQQDRVVAALRAALST